MVVCRTCLQEIECHEGQQKVGPVENPKIRYGNDGEELIECEWCNELFTEDEVKEI